MSRFVAAFAAVAAGLWVGLLFSMFLFASASFDRQNDVDLRDQTAKFADARLLMFELTETAQLALAGVLAFVAIVLLVLTRRKLAGVVVALAVLAGIGAACLPILVTGPMEAIRLDLADQGRLPGDSAEYMSLHGASFALYLGIGACVMLATALLGAGDWPTVAPRRHGRDDARAERYERELRNERLSGRRTR